MDITKVLQHDASKCAIQQYTLIYSYLIFVISFTQAKFSENEIYTEKRVNYKNRISRQNSVNQDLLGQAMKKVCKTKLSVKAHLVCVKLKKNTHKLHKLCEITH